MERHPEVSDDQGVQIICYRVASMLQVRYISYGGIIVGYMETLTAELMLWIIYQTKMLN